MIIAYLIILLIFYCTHNLHGADLLHNRFHMFYNNVDTLYTFYTKIHSNSPIYLFHVRAKRMNPRYVIRNRGSSFGSAAVSGGSYQERWYCVILLP